MKLPVNCFNRTFMELKSERVINYRLLTNVSIVPLWN